MIREATEQDIPRMVEMGRKFRAESSYAKHFADNPEALRSLGVKLLSSGGGILVAESNGELIGMLGFIVYDHFISGDKTAGEVFWWVEPDHRGTAGLKLLREAEKRSRNAGATWMQMIAPNDRVATLYGRLGYVFVESTYQRAL